MRAKEKKSISEVYTKWLEKYKELQTAMTDDAICEELEQEWRDAIQFVLISEMLKDLSSVISKYYPAQNLEEARARVRKFQERYNILNNTLNSTYFQEYAKDVAKDVVVAKLQRTKEVLSMLQKDVDTYEMLEDVDMFLKEM